MAAIVNRNLTRDDQAKKGWTLDFCCLEANKVDCAILERFLEKYKLVFLSEKNDQGIITDIKVCTAQDILNILV